MQSPWIKPVIGAAVLAILLLLHIVGFLVPVENGIRTLALPFARIGSRIGNLWSISENKSQIQQCENRLSIVTVDYIKLQTLQEENRILRENAKFLTDTGYTAVSARIIARSSDHFRAHILIDRGSIDHIELGMAVVSGNGIYVGKISSLRDHVSTVSLIADPDSRVAAAPITGNKLFGLVVGEGSGVARLTLVPQSDTLQVNDIIATAGTEEKIPPNLAIAIVNEVEGKSTDPFKTASLEPLARPETLQFVSVLVPSVLRQ